MSASSIAKFWSLFYIFTRDINYKTKLDTQETYDRSSALKATENQVQRTGRKKNRARENEPWVHLPKEHDLQRSKLRKINTIKKNKNQFERKAVVLNIFVWSEIYRRQRLGGDRNPSDLWSKCSCWIRYERVGRKCDWNRKNCEEPKRKEIEESQLWDESVFCLSWDSRSYFLSCSYL